MLLLLPKKVDDWLDYSRDRIRVSACSSGCFCLRASMILVSFTLETESSEQAKWTAHCHHS